MLLKRLANQNQLVIYKIIIDFLKVHLHVKMEFQKSLVIHITTIIIIPRNMQGIPQFIDLEYLFIFVRILSTYKFLNSIFGDGFIGMDNYVLKLT